FSLTAWKQCMCAGVTSFSIDLESKKVTVMGHVSPAGVLESVSKVKKAELLM
uniref:HMA domain-containing protein n=1 Tax=Aegilops tauschii subsp. strangulata TaxID=200361 RepID=A0A452Z990_AEGTS